MGREKRRIEGYQVDGGRRARGRTAGRDGDAEIGGGYFSAAGGDTSGEFHMVLIFVAASLQLNRTF